MSAEWYKNAGVHILIIKKPGKKMLVWGNMNEIQKTIKMYMLKITYWVLLLNVAEVKKQQQQQKKTKNKNKKTKEK